jgi:hypothetical protein
MPKIAARQFTDQPIYDLLPAGVGSDDGRVEVVTNEVFHSHRLWDGVLAHRHILQTSTLAGKLAVIDRGFCLASVPRKIKVAVQHVDLPLSTQLSQIWLFSYSGFQSRVL